MNDSPLETIPAFDRVSIRAVLVHNGEDPSAALAEAGIFDPIAIPVIIGEYLDESNGILGDGMTPNLIAVLETEQEQAFNASSRMQTAASRRDADAARPDGTATEMLPPAFGMQPLAPVRGG